MSNAHTTPMRRDWLNWLVLLMTGVVGFVFRLPILLAIGAWLDVGETPRKTDYILLLNGDVNCRPFVAAALAKRGFAEKVLTTSVRPAQEWRDSPWPAEQEVVRRILELRGVSPERIELIDAQCDSTFDEAAAFERYLRDYPTATATIVTSDFHTRRTRWIFRLVFGEQSRRLRFVSAPTDHYDKTDWWRVEAGFELYFSEYLKLAFYWFRYGSGFFWCGGLALLGAAWSWHRWRSNRNQIDLPRLDPQPESP